MNRGDALAGMLAGAGTMHVLAPAFSGGAQQVPLVRWALAVRQSA